MQRTIDLESVPNERAPAYVEQAHIRPAANLKDPEKIAASIAEKRQKLTESFALQWWTAKVIAISVVSDEHAPLCWYGEDEAKVLSAFGEYLLANPHATLCGKSTVDFDYPMLVGRFMALNLGVPNTLRTIEVDRVRDVDQIFGFSHASGQRGSLSDYAWGLGITGKLGKGNDVAGWFNMAQLGDKTAWERITQYCIQDSIIAHELLTRYRKPFQGTVSAQDALIQNPPF